MADAGYFPPGSVLRRVHQERIVAVLYGQRALLMQAAHPLAFAGLMRSTAGLEAPHARVAQTAKTMERIFFGSTAEVDRLTRRIRAMHRRVRGSIDEPVGRYPAGSSYTASSPEFLLWVLACLADSALCVYERFVGRLPDADRERFWQDYRRLGELFGLVRADSPATYPEFRAYMDDRLWSDDLLVTDEARRIARMVTLELPLPLIWRPALTGLNTAVVGLLPRRIRRLYGLSWDPARAVALEATARYLRLVGMPLLPEPLRRGSSARDYERVAAAEAAGAA